MVLRNEEIFHQSTDLPWTTARCHRLIRPLVNALRRWETTEASRDINSTTSSWPQSSTLKRIRLSRDDREDARDPDWGVYGSRKRLKRTYTKSSNSESALSSQDSKSASAQVSSSQPGEIIMPTPFLNKTLNHYAETQCAPTVSVCDLVAPSFRSTRPKSLKQDATKLEQYRVMNAFDQLLIATSEPCSSLQKESDQPIELLGARSLFSMCLRSVPAFMEDEQARRKEEDKDDKSDVAAETYAELENLGCIPGQGWKHLRAIVRAHGIFLFQEASRKLPCGIYPLLLHAKRTCYRNNAYAEADDLVSSWVLAGCRQISNPEFGTQRLLRTMKNGPNRCFTGLQMRLLSECIAAGAISAETLITQYEQKIWEAAIRSISVGDSDYGHATLFTTQALLSACGIYHESGEKMLDESARAPDQQALKAKISSLCAILTSIALIDHQKTSESEFSNTYERTMRPIRTASIEIVRVDQHEDYIFMPHHHINIRMVVLMADVVLSLKGLELGANTSSEVLSQRLSQLTRLNDAMKETDTADLTPTTSSPDLLTSIARCYGRARQDSSCSTLRDLLHRLLATTTHATSKRQALFTRRCVLDSALAFASQSTTDLDRLALAQEIERLIAAEPHQPHRARTSSSRQPLRSLAQAPHTPAKPTSTHAGASTGPGFRWEEGVCEWVAATPTTCPAATPFPPCPAPTAGMVVRVVIDVRPPSTVDAAKTVAVAGGSADTEVALQRPTRGSGKGRSMKMSQVRRAGGHRGKEEEQHNVEEDEEGDSEEDELSFHGPSGGSLYAAGLGTLGALLDH